MLNYTTLCAPTYSIYWNYSNTVYSRRNRQTAYTVLMIKNRCVISITLVGVAESDSSICYADFLFMQLQLLKDTCSCFATFQDITTSFRAFIQYKKTKQ